MKPQKNIVEEAYLAYSLVKILPKISKDFVEAPSIVIRGFWILSKLATLKYLTFPCRFFHAEGFWT